jgi:hypothetical protein
MLFTLKQSLEIAIDSNQQRLQYRARPISLSIFFNYGKNCLSVWSLNVCLSSGNIPGPMVHIVLNWQRKLLPSPNPGQFLAVWSFNPFDGRSGIRSVSGIQPTCQCQCPSACQTPLFRFKTALICLPTYNDRHLYFYLLLTAFIGPFVVYFLLLWFFYLLTALLPEWSLPLSLQHYSYLSFLLPVDCPHQFICCLLPSTIILLLVDWFQLLHITLICLFFCMFGPSVVVWPRLYCTVILLLVGCFFLSISRLLPSFSLSYCPRLSIWCVLLTSISLLYLLICFLWLYPSLFLSFGCLNLSIWKCILISFFCIVFPVL